MRHLSEYRDRRLVEKLASAISGIAPADRVVTLMEVCGTHTMAIARFGLKQLLPASVRLISGPGCPVCVTPKEYVDRAVALARRPDVVVATFGDMMRVPGSEGDLATARAEGADVHVVYSPLEAVEAAAAAPDKKIVFLAVGFETTAPATATALRVARSRGLNNFYLLVAHKLIPPALGALVEDGSAGLDGFLLPAHVSAVIGTAVYEFLPRRYNIPCVIAGFEPVDIMAGIYMLLRQIRAGAARVENEYARVVRAGGNVAAQRLLAEVYAVTDTAWRGLGPIPGSGLVLREEFAPWDAARALPVDVPATRPDAGCICGAVLTGTKSPADCPQFGVRCTPRAPLGPCMVSSEGTCAAAYVYAYE